MAEREELEQAIAALEAQRTILGDAVVETALRSLREKLDALAPPPPSSEQRKQATILFADLAGFTAMSEALDPEEVRAITSRYFYHITPSIRQYGGRIEKYIGDAVMAVFGIPTAQEQDVEHAIRAALEMQQSLQRLNDEMEGVWGFRLRMRVGINTGLVLVGYLGEDFTVVGDTVNLASRLEGAAPVGGVLISHHAYRHVRGIFDARALEPITVKGKVEPVPVYLVEGVKARAFQVLTRGVEGIETRTIGREAELQQMQDAWCVVLRERRMQAVLISADAGLGKSRLLYEFHNWMELRPNQDDWIHFPEQRFWLFQGRAQQETSKVPYALLRNLFAFRFEIQESDLPTVARAKLEQGMIRFMGEEMEEQEVLMRSHFLGHLIGLDFSDSPHLRGILHDTKQIHDRAFHYTTQFFALASKPRPVAIYLEDIHWADGGSLDLLAHLLRTCRELPLIFVCLARPTLAEQWPSWVEEKLFHQHIPLAPLSKEGMQRLVKEILREMDEVPQALSELIVGRAEGNPFYVEELIKMLIEEGVILTELGQWRVDPSQLLTTHVPPTLTGVLQARLDSLPQQERFVLQWASVIGRTFWEEAVAHLGKGSVSDTQVDSTLTALCKRELIFPQAGSAFLGTREYIFKHALLHEVTYETVLKQQRLPFHAQVARWLLRKGGSRAVEYAGLIASHFERAEERESAAEWYRRAGYQAQASHANSGAAEYFERALTLLPEGEQGKVCFDLGSVLEVMGRWQEAEVSYGKALTLAAARDDQRAQAQCRHALGRLANKRGDYQDSLNYLEVARQQFEGLDDAGGLSQTLGEIGFVFFREGEFAKVVPYQEESLAWAETIGDQSQVVIGLNRLGIMAAIQGDHEEAHQLFEGSLVRARGLGDTLRIAELLNNLGNLALEEGRYSDASACYEESLMLRREVLGDSHGISVCLLNLGRVTYHQGNQMAAQRLLQESLALMRKMGNKLGIADCLLYSGLVTHARGKYAESKLFYEESLALRREIGTKWGIATALGLLGYVALAEGQTHQAHMLCKDSLLLAQEYDQKNDIFLALIGLAGTAIQTEDYQQAAQLVAVTETMMTETKMVGPITRYLHERSKARARAALGEISFAEAWGEGETMTLDEAIAYALGADSLE